MESNDKIQLFEDKRIRTAWDEEKEEWYFSIVDVVGVLTDSENPRRYWSDLKRKLKAEGAEQLYENIVQLKMLSSDGKRYGTDVADTQQLLRIIRGGKVAGDARKAIEADTGKPVITSKSAVQLNEVVTDMIEGVVTQQNEEKEEASHGHPGH